MTTTQTVRGPRVAELLGTPSHPEPPRSLGTQPREFSDTVYRRAIAATRQQFVEDWSDLEMRVLHDASATGDGPYRHLRFTSKSSSLNRFDILTWPGHLTITGGIEQFTFVRLHDMMDFFGGKDPGSINPSYWAEKATAGRVKVFDIETYREVLTDEIADLGSHSAKDQETIRAAVHSLIDDEPESAQQAHRWVAGFSIDLPSGRTFQFYDTWEMDFEAYTHWYLMACHCIRHAVRTYRLAYPDRVIREVA